MYYLSLLLFYNCQMLVTETIWFTNPKILTIWPLQKIHISPRYT
jgi:hypothetical protein